MRREEVIERLSSGAFKKDQEAVQETLNDVPEKVLELLDDIERIEGHPLKRKNGEPVPGEYKPDQKKVILYGPDFNPSILFHELGHCIYHEFSGAEKFGIDEFHRSEDSDPLRQVHEDDPSEFMARAYEHFKEGELPSDWIPLKSYFEGNLNPYFEDNGL